MDTERMIRVLRGLYEEHKNDFVPTFEINWASVCFDVAIRLEDQMEVIKKYENLYGRID